MQTMTEMTNNATQTLSPSTHTEQQFLTLRQFYALECLRNGREFCDYPYISVICDALERCVAGALPDGKKNLLINIAPRTFKTSIVSRCFPAWCLTVAPECEFILTSATANLAFDNCRGVRRILDEPWVRSELPYCAKLDFTLKDTQQYFQTTAGGAVYAQGLGGTITGFGAGKARDHFGGAIIIDDPLKASDARSQLVLSRCIDYYNGVLKSRRNNVDSTPIICIMQRLHRDDLSGWILRNEADDWYHLVLPAVNEAGEVINPLTMSREELDRLKDVDPYTYYAQYQQEPITASGGMIKSEWWKTFDPSTVNQKLGFNFITADTAFKSHETNDESVLQYWHADNSGLYLLDGVSGRWEFPELTARMQGFYTVHKEHCREIFVEDKASGTPLVQTLRMQGLPVTAWKPSDFDFSEDKVGRVNDSAMLIYSGRVFVPQGATFADKLVEQSLLFQRDMSHLHDDHVDAMTMAVSVYKSMI